MGKDDCLDVWSWPVCTLHCFHSVSHNFLEKESQEVQCQDLLGLLWCFTLHTACKSKVCFFKKNGLYWLLWKTMDYIQICVWTTVPMEKYYYLPTVTSQSQSHAGASMATLEQHVITLCGLEQVGGSRKQQASKEKRNTLQKSHHCIAFSLFSPAAITILHVVLDGPPTSSFYGRWQNLALQEHLHSHLSFILSLLGFLIHCIAVTLGNRCHFTIQYARKRMHHWYEKYLLCKGSVQNSKRSRWALLLNFFVYNKQPQSCCFLTLFFFQLSRAQYQC